MVELLSSMVGMGLAASVSPVCITACLVQLASTDPHRRSRAYLSGAFLGVGIVGALAFLLLPLTGSSSLSDGWRRGIDVVSGLVLIVVGVVALVGRLRDRGAIDTDAAIDADTVTASGTAAVTLRRVILFAFVVNATNVTTGVIEIEAVRTILGESTTVSLAAISFATFAVVALLPMVVLVGAHEAAPGRCRPLLDVVGSIVERHGRSVLIGVCFLVGPYLLLRSR